MQPELWSRITDLFSTALEYPASERGSYLERACRGDRALHDQVAALLAHFEKSGRFLEEGFPFARPELTIGQVVSGRYRIEALLGRGGMGEVYRAHDELIGEQVSIKVLRRELADDPTVLGRFLREAQLARKVTHPSVCRVFDVGVHGDGRQKVHFLTMQLLEGETLAERIRREGALREDEALRFACELAAGLDAAHAAGVIHRDFKSANVMLCNGRAVIMDFGLARASITDADCAHGAGLTFTIGAQVAGTIAYMSPEQLCGEPVTVASDIYSLGIVLFEMATGRLPFDDQHIVRSAMERAVDAAPDLHRMAPELDARWATAIARCLRRDPAERFPDARSAADCLQPHWRPPMAYWTRRQWLKVAGATGAAAAALALVPVAFRYYRHDTRLPQGAKVLIGPIRNLTSDGELDAISELFRSQLAQSAHVSLIDDDSVSAAQRQMGIPESSRIDIASLREAAWRLNAMLSVFGTVARVGTDYVLNIQLETRGAQPGNPRTKTLRSFSAADPLALMRSVREASNWARAEIGESASSIASFDVLPDDATTPSWRALAHYARGQRLFMQQDFNAAIDKFAEALDEDPKFTLAALRRADLLISQNRQAEGFEQYRKALALLEERPVTRPEELYGRGMFALDAGDFDVADRYFRTWSREYPFDWRPSFYRMLPLTMNGHAAQALQLLERLQTTMPDYGDVYVQMSRVNLVLGETERARALLPEIRRLSRPERADLQEAYILFREADCVGCLQVLRRVQASPIYRRAAVDAMVVEGLLLIDAGYPQAAAANIEAFLRRGSWADTQPQQTELLIVQAWAEMLTGRQEAAIEHARQAVERNVGPLIIALAGTVLARLGAVERAAALERACTSFLDIPIYRTARHRIAGELARRDGDAARALAQLRQAASLEPLIAHRQYLIEALPPGSAEQVELAVKAVRVPWQRLRPPPLHHIGAMAIAVPIVIAAGLDEPFARKFAESSKKLQSIL